MNDISKIDKAQLGGVTFTRLSSGVYLANDQNGSAYSNLRKTILNCAIIPQFYAS